MPVGKIITKTSIVTDLTSASHAWALVSLVPWFKASMGKFVLILKMRENYIPRAKWGGISSVVRTIFSEVATPMAHSACEGESSSWHSWGHGSRRGSTRTTEDWRSRARGTGSMSLFVDIPVLSTTARRLKTIIRLFRGLLVPGGLGWRRKSDNVRRDGWWSLMLN